MNLGGRRLDRCRRRRTSSRRSWRIEAVRALLPLCPEEEAAPIREALSQLQMAYVRETGPATGAEPRRSAEARMPTSPPRPGEGQGPRQDLDAPGTSVGAAGP